MKQIKLSERLKTVAGFVSQGSGIIDVGTDHGFIPVYLAQTGYEGKIFASDINSGPIENARKTAREYGVCDKISFFLSDGLDFSDGNGISTVIIAGMGGENIEKIIAMAPWIHKNGVQLILQPQSKICDLVTFLDSMGYAIKDETLVRDAGRIYPVMCVYPASSRAPFFPGEMYVDRILLEKKDPLLGDYLQILISKLEKELHGMRKGKKTAYEDIAVHTELAIQGLKKMLEETEKWYQ